MTIRYPLVLNGNTIQELQSSDDLFGIPEVYNSANSAYGQANTATTIGSGAFGQANTARTHANAAFTTANAAFAVGTTASQINSATDTAFADADHIVARKSSDGSLIKRTWLNTKTALKTYFDLIYQPLSTILSTFSALSNGTGQLTNNGSGVLSWESSSNLGVGQTWKIPVSRTSGTSYQNTSNKPIALSGLHTTGSSATRALHISSDNVNWITMWSISAGSGAGVDAPGAFFAVVPPSHFYRFTTTSSVAILN